MNKNEAIRIVVREITFWDCNARDFFEALKLLSDDERQKIYLAIERQSHISLNGGYNHVLQGCN